MTVYIDQYILINTCMNYLILHITRTITKSKVTYKRLFVISLLSGIFSLFMIVWNTPVFIAIMLKCIFSFFLIYFSYKPKSTASFVRNACAFYTVSFAAGGCGYVIQNTIYADIIIILIITTLISYIIITSISKIYEKYYRLDKLSHKLEISFNNKNIETSGFYDTGNNLTDPITKLPVIITGIKTIRNLFPETFTYELLHDRNITDIYISFGKEYKLKFIPYNSVGGNGFLLGFVPDKILIDNKETNAVVGIATNNFTYEKNYNAILNTQLII